VSIQALKTKYPVLTDTTISLPYYPKNHGHADTLPVQIDLSAVNGFVSELFPSFWQTSFIGEPENCDGKSKAQLFVYNLLTAILKGLKLNGLIEISMSKSLAGAECDILLLYKPNHLPFAVLEVKKPGNSVEGCQLIWEGLPLENRDTSKECGGHRVAGEIYDAMKAIQLFGFATVTGMITTWNQWQMVGLLNEVASCDSAVLDVSDLFETFKIFHQWNQPHLEVDNAMYPDLKQISPEHRRMYSASVLGDTLNPQSNREIWASGIIPSHQDKTASELTLEVEQHGEPIAYQLVLFVVKAWGDLQKLLKLDPFAGLAINRIKIRNVMPCLILRKVKQDGIKDNLDCFALEQCS
jgi:hypothetical protein